MSMIQTEREGKSDDGSNIIESTSEQIKNKYRFAALPSKELLYYKNGVYTTGWRNHN